MRVPGRVQYPTLLDRDKLVVGKPESGTEAGGGVDDIARITRQPLIDFCAGLGYELNIVGSPSEIPAIRRDFEEALHAGDQIWVVSMTVDLGFVWHEAGHAFAAECQGPGMTEGLHWTLNGREADEGYACAAAGAIMEHFGVPQKMQDDINEHVNHFPHEDHDEGLAHAEDQAKWGQLLALWTETEDIHQCRTLFLTLFGS